MILEVAQLVLEVRLDVLPTLGEAGYAVGPAVDALEEVVAELLLVGQILIGAADELEVALDRRVRPHLVEDVFFKGLEEHRLHVPREVADFVQEEDAFLGGFDESIPVLLGTCECALDVSEEFAAGGRRIKRCAIDRDELALDEVVLLLEGVDFGRELGLARAGRSRDENRVG